MVLTKSNTTKLMKKGIDSLYCHAPVSAGHETNTKWVVGFLSTDAFDQKIFLLLIPVVVAIFYSKSNSPLVR